MPEPATNDEVLDLTRSFNAMASSLRDREEKLKTANTELAVANESLQKVNGNYLDMLGFVSHELKNTLGVIYTSARALDMGLTGPLTENQATLVHGIAKSINTAVIMTRNYLDLARIEKAELKLEIKPMDMVKDVVNPVLHELSPALIENGMALKNELPETLPAKGDTDLLQIVFKNLLNNAIAYGRKSGAIKIGFKKEEKDLVFEVWNEGEGLSPDQISRLFGKFIRFNKEKNKSRGTGLGLFITKDIIEKHGGRIKAESQMGAWIAFIFTLPGI